MYRTILLWAIQPKNRLKYLGLTTLTFSQSATSRNLRAVKSYFLWSGNQEPHRRIAIAMMANSKRESDLRQLEKRILETLPAQQSEHSVSLIRFFVLQSLQSSHNFWEQRTIKSDTPILVWSTSIHYCTRLNISLRYILIHLMQQQWLR